MTNKRQHGGEEGYLLLGLTVAVFLLLLAMSIAAPLMAKRLEREKEVEAARRGQQYMRAIHVFHRKNRVYPNSLDQLDETNNEHYLRRHYVDPLTGGEYRLIPLGEQQTVVKGFFGMPLAGIGSPGGGVGGPNSSNGIGGSGTNPQAGGTGSGLTIGNSPDSSGLSGSTGGIGSSNGAGGIGSSGSTGSGGSLFGGDVKGGKGAIVGVGTNKKGKAIVAVNGEDDFEKWEFIYDPRIEEIQAKVGIFGGGPAAGAAPGIGSGSSPGLGGSNTTTSSPTFGPSSQGTGSGSSGGLSGGKDAVP